MKIFFIFLVLLSVSVCYSQEQSWTNYPYEGKINSIAVKGDYVWLAKSNSLVKYNIKSDQKVIYNTSNSGLPVNQIQAVSVDSNGVVWIGTEGAGLVSFDGKTWNTNFPYFRVNCIAVDPQNVLWLGTYLGLVKFDGLNWTIYNETNSAIKIPVVISISVDKDGNKWIGTLGEDVLKFDGSTWTNYNSNYDSWKYSIHDIAIDKDNNIWIATWGNGLGKYDGTSWTFYDTTNSGINSNAIDKICIDEDNNKWLGSLTKGLIKFDGINWTLYNSQNSILTSNSIRSMQLDKKNKVWLGIENDIVSIEKDKWNIKHPYKSLLTGPVYDIQIDAEENKWLMCGKMVKYDGNKWIQKSTNYFSSNIIIDRDVWIGAPSRLYRLSNDSWNYFSSPLINLTRIQSIAMDSYGAIWGGTDNRGLFKFDGSSWEIYDTLYSNLTTNSVNEVVIDQDNIKWLGTKNGLMKFESAFSSKLFSTKNSGMPSNSVQDIQIDKFGKKWIGTSGGLAIFDGNEWEVYNKENSGLTHNKVNAIAFDGAGQAWIGTEAGILKLNNNEWTIFDTSNSNLLSNKVNSITIDKDGYKWIGTGDGLSIFKEDSTVDVDGNSQKVPDSYSLSQNYPNPFNAMTVIEFQLPRAGYIDLTVYDILGNKIENLINSYLEKGNHKIKFDAERIASGIYLYRISSGNYTKAKKMILMK